mmetsp:Transcript_4506/g.17040  ORF Transcript_4506/g.17040 Transcript_4506/m.17040 type:complete len:173 (+) Transcript_4506:60-578(+)
MNHPFSSNSFPPHQQSQYFPANSSNPYSWQSQYQNLPSHASPYSFYGGNAAANNYASPQDQIFSNDEMQYINRPTMHRSSLLASPSFPNLSLKHAISTNVTLESGRTVALQSQEREKVFRGRYWSGWKWYRMSGWLKVLVYAFRWLIGLNIDTVKKVKVSNMIYLTGYVLPT